MQEEEEERATDKPEDDSLLEEKKATDQPEEGGLKGGTEGH